MVVSLTSQTGRGTDLQVTLTCMVESEYPSLAITQVSRRVRLTHVHTDQPQVEVGWGRGGSDDHESVKSKHLTLSLSLTCVRDSECLTLVVIQVPDHV